MFRGRWPRGHCEGCHQEATARVVWPPARGERTWRHWLSLGDRLCHWHAEMAEAHGFRVRWDRW